MEYTIRFKHVAPALGLLAVLLLYAGAAGAQAEPMKPRLVTCKETVDSEGKAVELRLHVFAKDKGQEGDKRPAIIFFFGGGWVGGSPAQFYPHCRELAARGMVAMAAEYRVRGRHGTPPQACVEDGKSAIRLVRRVAKEFRVDPDRLVAAGGSAGGHVAACAGILKGYEAEGEDHKVSSKPNLMILFNPVLDTSRETGYGARKVGDDPESLSPLHQAHKDQPPALVLHGDADKTVSIQSIRRFEKRCEELGAECRLVEYEGAGHGFFNHKSFRGQKPGDPDYYKLTMQEVVAFLEGFGYLEKPAGE